MSFQKKQDWFRIKRYPHIGLPLSAANDETWLRAYITNPSKIASHSFLPFIHKTSKQRKFRKQYSADSGLVIKEANGKILRKASVKPRELYYASHFDSLIYSYYAHKLSALYEEELVKLGLNSHVTAYRSIRIFPKHLESPRKCNIDFAEELFQEIHRYNAQTFCAIAFDIEKFFDSLNHDLLLRAWAKLIKHTKLPPDHFTIYKNITRFSYVNLVDLFETFKNNIIVQVFDKKGNVTGNKRKPIAKLKYLRNQNAIAFCTKDEFLLKKSKLIKNQKYLKIDGNRQIRKFGIPQGSPISSVLANIYLLEFDKTISSKVSKFGGIYKRYSDDMVVICPQDKSKCVIEMLTSEISKYKLNIQHSKTQIFVYQRINNQLVCGQQFPNGINWNKTFQYLGFEFDGNFAKLKSASLSGYYRKMKRTIARSKAFASRIHAKNHGHIFRRRIFKKFSYKGANRRRIWTWDPKKGGFALSNKFDWGNYISYARKAAKMKIANKISEQTRRHWYLLNKLLDKKGK